MPIVSVIHPIHIVRYPAGISLDAYQFQFGMTLEDAAEDEGADDVLASPDDRQEAVQFGSASLEVVGAAGEYVKAERHLEIDRCFVKRIVDLVVVVLEFRIPGHHDALQPERLHLAQIFDSFLDGSHRGLSAPDESFRMRVAILTDP